MRKIDKEMVMEGFSKNPGRMSKTRKTRMRNEKKSLMKR